MALVECKECGAKVSKKATACPECGAPAKKKTSGFTWFVLIVIGLIVYVSSTMEPEAPPVALTPEQKIAREVELVAELRAIPASDYRDNLERYIELVALVPGNDVYVKKVVHYNGVKRRADSISYQFELGNNGAHKNLRAYVLKSLKDPDSFQHVKSVYNDNGDHIVVEMRYRGKNSFGAVVPEAVRARCTIAGDCTLL